MGSQNPPQGWEMDTGTWGTDADRDDSLSETGQYTLHLKNTAVATKIDGPMISVEKDLTLMVGARVRADDVSAGRIVALVLEQYNGNRLSSSFTDIYRTTLAAANTWQWVGQAIALSATTRYVSLRVEKAAVAFHVYWDFVLLERAQPSWARQRAAALSIGSGAWTPIDFDGWIIPASATMIESRCSEAAGVITIWVPGMYRIQAVARFDTTGETKNSTYQIRLKIVGPVNTVYRYGSVHFDPNQPLTTIATVMVDVNELLEYGNTVEVEVYQNSGNAVSLITTSSYNVYTYFTGCRFGKV